MIAEKKQQQHFRVTGLHGIKLYRLECVMSIYWSHAISSGHTQQRNKTPTCINYIAPKNSHLLNVVSTLIVATAM